MRTNAKALTLLNPQPKSLHITHGVWLKEYPEHKTPDVTGV